MKKLSFKNKVYILIAFVVILSLIADIFNVLEINRYNGLMFILLLTILFIGIQYIAAKKGLETMLSINRDYQVRKQWNIENQFDWEKVRTNQIKWAPISIGISLIEIVTLYLTGEKYTLLLMITWAMGTLIYSYFSRPLKYK